MHESANFSALPHRSSRILHLTSPICVDVKTVPTVPIPLRAALSHPPSLKNVLLTVSAHPFFFLIHKLAADSPRRNGVRLLRNHNVGYSITLKFYSCGLLYQMKLSLNLDMTPFSVHDFFATTVVMEMFSLRFDLALLQSYCFRIHAICRFSRNCNEKDAHSTARLTDGVVN